MVKRLRKIQINRFSTAFTLDMELPWWKNLPQRKESLIKIHANIWLAINNQMSTREGPPTTIYMVKYTWHRQCICTCVFMVLVYLWSFWSETLRLEAQKPGKPPFSWGPRVGTPQVKDLNIKGPRRRTVFALN